MLEVLVGLVDGVLEVAVVDEAILASVQLVDKGRDLILVEVTHGVSRSFPILSSFVLFFFPRWSTLPEDWSSGLLKCVVVLLSCASTSRMEILEQPHYIHAALDSGSAQDYPCPPVSLKSK